MSSIRDVRDQGWCVHLDLSSQVLEIDIPRFADDYPWSNREPLRPIPLVGKAVPVSAASLLLKAKQFDDGLYATVELAAQQGMGRFCGKVSLLQSLAATLVADLPNTQNAAATIHAACQLSGLPVVAPESIGNAVATLVAGFLQDELQSKPLGFYTWTPELSAIFRQDRFLQQPVDSAIADDLACALEQTPAVSEVYNACLRLNARLTNPPARKGLRDRSGRRAFFPAARSHEQLLLEMLYGDRPIPESFDLMSELIRRVRAGEIRLEPTESSGWYDHQTWSLEPLIVPQTMPEASRLTVGSRYSKYLEDLFRGALALARETHARPLALGAGGGIRLRQHPIWVTPGLTVEPLPSLYARRAASYHFVRSVLEEAFGIDTLRGMHRLTQEGHCEDSLLDELTRMAELFDGAAAVAHRELGTEPTAEEEGPARRFSDWRAKRAADPDLSRDARMMVPVFYDLQRKKTKVWALLGWRTVSVEVTYRVEPVVLGIERDSPVKPEPADRVAELRRKFRKQPDEEPAEPPPVQFVADRYEFAVPVVAEIYVSRLLNRDEFRRFCDCLETRDAILANLS